MVNNMNKEISHEQIYERLCAVEAKVVTLYENTKDIVAAFNSASGAFTVLEWVAKAVKPLIVIGAFFGAIWLAVENKLHQ